jgi:hypothetical protein
MYPCVCRNENRIADITYVHVVPSTVACLWYCVGNSELECERESHTKFPGMPFVCRVVGGCHSASLVMYITSVAPV